MSDQEAWRKRQQQWARFHEWEMTQPPLPLSPSQQLAEVGWLADKVLEAQRRHAGATPDIAERAAGIIVMRQRLAILHRAA